MRCPGCGRKLNKAEQLWTKTHGGKQCPHCRSGPQAARGRAHVHGSGVKKGQRGRRGDRRLAA